MTLNYGAKTRVWPMATHRHIQCRHLRKKIHFFSHSTIGMAVTEFAHVRSFHSIRMQIWARSLLSASTLRLLLIFPLTFNHISFSTIVSFSIPCCICVTGICFCFFLFCFYKIGELLCRQHYANGDDDDHSDHWECEYFSMLFSLGS